MSAAEGPYSEVARGQTPRPLWVKMAIGAGIAFVGVGLMSWLIFGVGNAPPPAALQPDYNPGPQVHLDPVDTAPPETAPAAQGQAQAGPAPARVHMMQVWSDPAMAAPAVAGTATTAANGLGSALSGGGAGKGGAANGGAAADPDDHSDPLSLHGEEKDTVQAHTSGDLGTLIEQGVSFECLSKGPINTQFKAQVVCRVGEDVWSADLTRILIQKYSTVTGEVYPLEASGGVDRAFITWNHLRTNECVVNLDSPGTDELGEIGVPGILQEHLWRKIKAAVILSGVEAITGAAQSLAQSNQNSQLTNLNFNQGSTLAQQALAHDINIPTTIWRGVASPLRISIQHDLRFGHCYKLRMAANAR